MSEYEPQVSVSDYINRPIIGKPESVTRVQIDYSPIDPESFQKMYCGGCPGCTIQPGTVFVKGFLSDIKGTRSANSITLVVEGETINQVKGKIRRLNCPKRTGAMDLVEAKLGEHGLSR